MSQTLPKRVETLGTALLDRVRLAPFASGIGRQIQARVNAFYSAFTQSLAQDWDLLNRLMRFVDVLPVLDSPQEVRRHFREYFPNPSPAYPKSFNFCVQSAQSPALPDFLFAKATREAVRLMAKRFVAGVDTKKTLRRFTEMAENGRGVIADILGEAVVSDFEADRMLSKYLELIEALSNHAPFLRASAVQGVRNRPFKTFNLKQGALIQIALKLSSLVPYAQWNAAAPEVTGEHAKKRLRILLDAILGAEKKGIAVSLAIDPEEFEYRDLTVRVFKEILSEERYRRMERVGIGLQTYLTDSLEIIRGLAQWSLERRANGGGHSVLIRLVKGAYWDFENLRSAQYGYPLPVYQNKNETDASMESAIDLVSDHSELRLAVASHNIRTIAYAMAKAEEKNVPFEIQMLYGMAEDLQDALVKEGVAVHVYSPVGDLIEGMAYLARRIIENSSQQSFLLQQSLGRDPQALLADPAALPSTAKPSLPKNSATFENEPLIDFSQEKNRIAVTNALQGLSLTGISPVAPQSVASRVAAARAAQKAWQVISIQHRAELLRKTAQLMREHRSELTALILSEAAKPLREADADVAEAIDFLEFYASDALRIQNENPNSHFNAIGVAAIIAPWNFPLAILTGMASAALVAGNAVLLKPSHQTPRIAARFLDLCLKAGFPQNVVQLLAGDKKIGEALVDAEPDLVAFTGSRDVGLSIYRRLAGAGKRVIAEMGGKNALILDSDADPDQSIKTVLHSKFGYGGQKCSALDRVIFIGDARRYQRFCKRLVEAMACMPVGDAADFKNFYGPVIDEAAAARLRQLLSDKSPNDARFLYDGRTHPITDLNPRLMGPSLLEVSNPNSDWFQEEFFGPILTILRTDGRESAVALAHHSQFGLTGGVETRSPANERFFKEAFHAVGNLYLHRPQTGARVGRQPFGGTKLSGIGGFKAGGRDYLWQFWEVFPAKKMGEFEETFRSVGAKTQEEFGLKRNTSPDLLGETNHLEFQKRGRGLIVVTRTTSLSQFAGYLSLALHAKNSALISCDPERLPEIRGKVQALGAEFSGHIEIQPHPADAAERESLARKPDIFWIAFGSKEEADSLMLKAAAETNAPFVRTITWADVTANFPFVFSQLTQSRLICVNTSRHGISPASIQA